MVPTLMRWLRRRRAAAALLTAFAVGSCDEADVVGLRTSTTFNVGTAIHPLVVGALSRSYVLHVPRRRPVGTGGVLVSYPLIIVLHGSSATGADIRNATNMDSVSEANRWVAAYPNALRGSGGLFPSDWNAGTCCGAAARENFDDVGFIASMINEISRSLPIDAKRVYVVGFSDGGRMAYTVACAMSSQIAGIGVVSGSLKQEGCLPARPVALIAIHGTDDPSVPWDDESSTPPPTAPTGLVAAMPPSLQLWSAVNACKTGTLTQLSTYVELITLPTCAGAEIAFYSIAGGIHTWPSLKSATSSDPDETLAATALIAQFLRRQTVK